ncbi:hypothetical protein UlMin_008808 [Ulmus minor]
MEYYTELDFSISQENPSINSNYINSLPSFIFHLEFREEDRLGQDLVTTAASSRITFKVPREAFIRVPRIYTFRMLSAVGVMPGYINAGIMQNIASKIFQIADQPHNHGAGQLYLSLRVLAVHHYFNQESFELVLMESANQDTFMTVPATKSSIEELEEVKIESSDTITTDCRICLEDFLSTLNCDGQEQKVVRLPCTHLFHKDCIVQWLETSHFCPLCRFAMPFS